MAQTYATCGYCIKLFEDAASILSQSSEEESTVIHFDASSQTRLAANVSLLRCHMCILLDASIPRLLKPLNSKELLVLSTSRARYDPEAVTVSLVGLERKKLGHHLHYDGVLRIQDGEKEGQTSQA
jgi:hypothetical protein